MGEDLSHAGKKNNVNGRVPCGVNRQLLMIKNKQHTTISKITTQLPCLTIFIIFVNTGIIDRDCSSPLGILHVNLLSKDFAIY